MACHAIPARPKSLGWGYPSQNQGKPGSKPASSLAVPPGELQNFSRVGGGDRRQGTGWIGSHPRRSPAGVRLRTPGPEIPGTGDGQGLGAAGSGTRPSPTSSSAAVTRTAAPVSRCGGCPKRRQPAAGSRRLGPRRPPGPTRAKRAGQRHHPDRGHPGFPGDRRGDPAMNSDLAIETVACENGMSCSGCAAGSTPAAHPCCRPAASGCVAIDNAIKFTPRGSNIVLRADRYHDDTGDWVRVEVRAEPGRPFPAGLDRPRSSSPRLRWCPAWPRSARRRGPRRFPR